MVLVDLVHNGQFTEASAWDLHGDAAADRTSLLDHNLEAVFFVAFHFSGDLAVVSEANLVSFAQDGRHISTVDLDALMGAGDGFIVAADLH